MAYGDHYPISTGDSESMTALGLKARKMAIGEVLAVNTLKTFRIETSRPSNLFEVCFAIILTHNVNLTLVFRCQ